MYFVLFQQVFQRIREEKPATFKKIVPFFGDVLQEGLGLTEEARRRITEEATIIIHSAATLKLEAKLKDAVQMNLLGTHRVLELAKQTKNLLVRKQAAKQSFIYYYYLFLGGKCKLEVQNPQHTATHRDLLYWPLE